jgi:opacity protein-like surface antigen
MESRMQLDHRLVISAGAILALSASTIAEAQNIVVATRKESGPYVGALLGYSSIDVGLTDWNNALAGIPKPGGSTLTSSSVDKGDFSWGLNAGYRIMRNFAVELAYLDLGKSRGDVSGTIGGRAATGRADIKSSGVEAAAIGIIPLDSGWGFDGRLGLYYGDNKVQVNGSTSTGAFDYENSGNKSSFLGGVGVFFTFLNNTQVRFDYMYIDKVGDAGKLRYTAPVDSFTLGFRFGW